MNSISKSGLRSLLCRLVLALLLVGVCQVGARADVSEVSVPVFNPAGCDFSTPMSVEIIADQGCDIYYTTDGSDPVVDDGNKYSVPIVVSSTTTIKAVAVDKAGNSSLMSSAEYNCVRHGIGEDYNPDSPGNPGSDPGDIPEKLYRLTVVANPVGAGSVYPNSYDLRAGEKIYINTHGQSGFEFLNWTIEGKEISDSSSFYYVMPEYDVTIVANYSYNPQSPGNPSPEEQKVKHPVVVRAIPSGAASLSPSGTFDMEENTSRQIYAYPNTGWKLTGWTINGEQLESVSSPINVTMGEKALDIVAYFTYNPTSPSNPGANYYNPTTGQVIIDDFTPGYLYNALDNLVGYSDFSNISSIIVKGEINSNDLGVVDYLNNTATIDLTRTGGLTSIPGYTFSSSGASSILLPSTIEKMGHYVFSGCENLSSITVYALVPPLCDAYAFSDFANKDNCTIYVPASAIELYSSADYWKDFTILPITTDAHVLQVNLPEDADDGRYKNYSIELVNLGSGVRQKYVISDRSLYTFNGLQKDEQYNIYMYSQAGLEIGRIENVIISDQDIEVTFDNLKKLYTVFAKVVTQDDTDVTSDVSVEWLKVLADGTTTYLRKATSIGEIPEGQALLCRVTLNNQLGTIYATPEDTEFTVGNEQNTCTINLVPFRSIALSGTVVDGDGAALSGAFVSVNQTLNDKFSKSYTTKTDRQGKWTLSVLDAPETRLTYAANECVNVNDTIGVFEPEVSSFDLGKTTLKSIVGARVTYGFTYHAAGVEVAEDYYSDYQNVALSVYNVTQDRRHDEISLQYPIVAVLDENINTGDQLRLTATSKTGAFNPIEETVAVDENQRAEVTFDIVGKGGISASFEMTENPTVVGMLYSSNGEFLKKMNYTEATAKFTSLEDGDYTLVTMGQSDLMNSILRLSSFDEIGLTEGRDYVRNSVKVESGKLAEVKNSEIPAFDESLFYYTNSSTSFTSNKSSITTGNYLTLRSAIDFKSVYKDGISNVALIVDLPEACDFVEQSVIQGPNQLPYTLDNNRLTIQLGSNYLSQVRFCVVPTNGGSFNACASIAFDYSGKTVTQPIGTAVAEIKNLDFIVPSTLTSETFKASGMAPGGARVEVYEDGILIGHGNALSNGNWNVECTLPSTYNLTSHAINAVITTKDGIVLNSETLTVEFDRYCTEPKTVHMTFYNGWLGKNVNVTFNFANLTVDNPNYMFYTTTKLTFVADFTLNSPEVLSNVTLWTLSSDNTETALPMEYDEASGKWIASHDFDYYHAPRNIALEYEVMGEPVFDRRQFMDAINEQQAIIADNLAERANFITEFDAEVPEDEIGKRLTELFEQDEPDEAEIRQLLGMDPEPSETPVTGIADEEFEALCAQSDASWEDWEMNGAAEMRETVLTDYYADPDMDYLADFEITTDLEDGIKTVIRQTLTAVNPEELEAAGYASVTLDDGSSVYVLYNEGSMEIVDCGQLVKYSIATERTGSPVRVAGAKVPILPGNYLLYADVARRAIQAIATLQTLDKRRWIVEVALKFQEATEAISQFYEGFMNDFNKGIQYAYDKLNILSDSKLEEQQVLAEEAEEKIKEYTDKIESNKKQREVMESNRKLVKNSTTISEEQKQKLIQEYDEGIQKLTDENKSLNGKRAGANTQLKRANTRVAEIKEQSSKFRKVHTKIRETLDHFPKKLSKGLRMPKFLRACGKIAGQLGLPLQCWSLFTDMMDMADDMTAWIPVMDYIDNHKCYKKPTDEAKSLHEAIYDSANSHALQNIGIVTTEIGAIVFSLAEGVPGSPTWWAELGCSVIAEVWKHFNDKGSVNERKQYNKDINALKCDDKDDDDKDKDKKKDKKRKYPFQSTNPIHDPSGFVYEAIPANRVEGVQASIYYKETKEDMYGDPYDEVILWDAEEYAQKNPLFTDENGMYRWDVPQGLWQVKFEKDGYVTAYSEWLPVPPPQLEVNIGILQNKQPEVVEARAYEEGVEVQFDKFMDISTLNTNNIYVTAGGEKLSGEVRLLDSELADEYADEEDASATRYASRVRFVPNEPLSVNTGEIRLTVNRNVLSYAGIPMPQTYSQPLDVEKEVQVIAAEDVKVLYGGEKEITIFALPFEAAANRMLHISTSSDLITSIDKTEAVIDEEGKATVIVKGDLPGRAQLSFSIDDVTVTGECTIDVVTEIINAEAPKASRASGTAVYRGTKVELTTESKDGVIYFTTDGSCPCDENGTRRKYTVPIIINEDTKILAMTSVGTGDDDVSETVEFNYTLKRSDMDFTMDEGWTWISHNFDIPIAVETMAADENVHAIMGQTEEVIRDPELGLTGLLTELVASESYKVETTGTTARQRVTDYTWNPANPIDIESGWNWLGYPVGQTMSVDEAFAPTNVENLDVIVGQNGFAQFDGEKWVGTLETLSPGLGYMYQSQSAKKVIYNTSIVSKAAAHYASGICENSPLVVDIHKYPSVMPVVATLINDEGASLDNDDYRVYAFSGTECRGIGKLVNGLVMMNVYGNFGDNISFQVTNLDGSMVFANNSSQSFCEDIVGSISNPYEISINSATGIRNVTYDGPIKVRVVGDMLVIKGIAADDIDLVEVYDVDGHKLIHESSVSESGIRISHLTSGVYVVIVNGNGDYSYHKISLR